jgi:ABC-type glycerol-3-phosphate transport system substrate-binding protein
MLAACQPDTAPAPEAEEGDEPTPQLDVQPEELQLRFQTHGYTPLTEYVDRKIEEYKEIAPNISVEHVHSEEAEDKKVTNMAAGTGPDGFNLPDREYTMFLKNDWLAPVDPIAFDMGSQQEVMDLFIPASIDALAREGQLYGVPLEWQCLVLYYNMHHFEEAGLDPMQPPETLEEFTEYGLKLVKYDEAGNIIRQGINLLPYAVVTLFRWRPMMYQLGGRWLSEDGTKAVFNSPESKEAIQLNIDWTLKHKVSARGFEVPGVSPLYGSDYVSMWLWHLAIPAQLKQAYPDLEYQVDWNVARFPHFADHPRATGGWRWAFFANNDSEATVETWAFIDFLVQDWYALLYDVGYVPSIKTWQNDPQSEQAFEDMPWLNVMMEDLQVAVPMPMIANFYEVAELWYEAVDRMYEGVSVDEATDTAVEEINTLLAENT